MTRKLIELGPGKRRPGNVPPPGRKRSDVLAFEDLFNRLDRSLTNHTPNEAQIRRIEEVRYRAKMLGYIIITRVPEGRERSLALTHLEETTMWAVKAIVLE